MPDNNWGPVSGLNSKSYLLSIAQEDPTLVAQDLPNHTLGGVSQNLIDALFIPRTELVQGVIRTRYIVSRSAEETHREYTLGFPMGLLYSPALEIARYKSFCERDFFATYLCPDDTQYEHFVVYTNARLSPPVETEDFITVDDTNAIGEQSTMLLEQRLLKWALFGREIASAQVDTGASVSIGNVDCGGCEGKLYENMLVGGGDGLAAPELTQSTNAGSSFTSVTITGATIAYYVTDSWQKGDVIILALADDPDPATATVGEIAVSLDNGVTWAINASATNAYFAVDEYNGEVLVAGADGELWVSADYVNFTQITTPTAFATKHFTDIAVDEVNKIAYLSATGGGAVALEDDTAGDMSTAVGAGATDLLTVAVLAPGQIVFAGATGFYTESVDGGSTFTAGSVAGLATDIVRVRGSRYRVVAGSGTAVYERSLLTNMVFAAMPLRFGQTIGAAVADIEVAPGENGDNFFAVVDVAGDVYLFRPMYPGA
jgi:hypothetical protein